MIAPELWYEKAQLAGQAARRELDADNLPAAANRAYFSLYAFLVGRLIDSGQQPPARGNWPHSQLSDLVRLHFKPSFHKRLITCLVVDLRQVRAFADYDDHKRLTSARLSELLRSLGQVVSSQER
jgi:hypothetical protein